MKLMALLVVSVVAHAETFDFYPQVHALVLEAETAAANASKQPPDGKGDPYEWAGSILARAGYLRDAENAYSKSRAGIAGPYTLWRAWVVYGQPERAEALIADTKEPGEKASLRAAYGDLLWRMGQPEKARLQFESARAMLAKAANPSEQKRVKERIDQALKYVSFPPPNVVTPVPHPLRFVKPHDSGIPDFPITADGFQNLDGNEAATRNRENGELMTKLYACAANGDRACMEKLVTNSLTPFQLALAYASLEHLCILQRQPEIAERYAREIPHTDAPSSLASAEALSSAAAAWLRAVNNDKAVADFSAAVELAASVRELPWGQVCVLSSIGAKEYAGGLTDDAEKSFATAIEIAGGFPHAPRNRAHSMLTQPGARYMGDAFKRIMAEGIRVGDFHVAKVAADKWSQKAPGVDRSIVDLWLTEGRVEEAIALARAISNPTNRAEALLSISSHLLDEAGAPIF